MYIGVVREPFISVALYEYAISVSVGVKSVVVTLNASTSNDEDDVDDVVGALPQLQLEDNQVVDHESDSESGYESDGLIIQQ